METTIFVFVVATLGFFFSGIVILFWPRPRFALETGEALLEEHVG